MRIAVAVPNAADSMITLSSVLRFAVTVVLLSTDAIMHGLL